MPRERSPRESVYDVDQRFPNPLECRDHSHQWQHEARGLTLNEAESASSGDLGNTRSSRITHLDSVISQAEQLRDQQLEQEYNDRFGVYVQEKAEQINRLKSDLAEAIASEQRQLDVIQQTRPGWSAGKQARTQWRQRIAQHQARIAQLTVRLERVGEIKEAAGIYAETKVQELAERKLRFDNPKLAEEWDKIQRRERQALIPTIESTQSLGQDLGRSLTLSITPEKES